MPLLHNAVTKTDLVWHSLGHRRKETSGNLETFLSRIDFKIICNLSFFKLSIKKDATYNIKIYKFINSVVYKSCRAKI